MAVAGNTGGAGGAKNVARAQRKPKPKRANVYVPPAALAKPVKPPAPVRRTGPPAAPSPVVKAAHARRGRDIVRAREVRDVRRGVVQGAVNAVRSAAAPNFPTYVPKKPGQIPVVPKKQARGAPNFPRYVPKHPGQIVGKGAPELRAPGREMTGKEVGKSLDDLFTPGRKLKDQSDTVEALRQAGAVQGKSKLQRRYEHQLDETARQAKAAAREAARKDREDKKKDHGVLGDVAHVAESAVKSTGVYRQAKGLVSPAYHVLKPLQKAAENEAKGKHPKGTTAATLVVADKLLSGQLTQGAVKFAKRVTPTAAKIVNPAYGVTSIAAKKAGGPVKAIFDEADRAVVDATDIAANVLPSSYYAARESIAGGSKGRKTVAKQFAKGYTEIYHHPGRELKHRPVTTALTLAPIPGTGKLLGGAGRLAARVAPEGSAVARAGRAVGSTKRAPLTVAGSRARVERDYSANTYYKAAQVLGEKVGRRVHGTKAGQMTGKRIAKETTGEVRTMRNVQSAGEHEAVQELKTVASRRKSGRGGRGLRKATTAHTLGVQGLYDLTKPGLEKLLRHTEDVSKGLKSDALAENKALQRDIHEALDKWSKDPAETEGNLRQAVGGFRELDEKTAQRLIDSGVMTRAEADQARWSGPAVLHGMHDPEAAPSHVAQAKGTKRRAGSAKRKAARRVASAISTREKTLASVRAAEKAGGRSAKIDDLEPVRASTQAHAEARHDLRSHERGLENDVKATEAELRRARNAADRVAGEKPNDPAVIAARQQTQASRAEYNRLSKEASARGLTGARAEGRAQARVGDADRQRARDLTEAQRQARLADTAATTARERVTTLRKAGPETPAGALEAAIENVGKTLQHQERAHAHVKKLSSRKPGTEPRKQLANLERRGGADLEHAQAVERARTKMLADENTLDAALTRSKGVPEPHADRLRRAVDAHDRARGAHRTREGVPERRSRVAQTGRAMRDTRKQYALSPEQQGRAWKAIYDAEDARAAHKTAIAEHDTAGQRLRDLQEADFIDREGNPISIADVAERQKQARMPEPSYLSHTDPFAGARGVIPTERVRQVHQRGGEMAASMRLRGSPEAITGTRVARSRMADQAEARHSFLERWGYRATSDSPVRPFRTEGEATLAARELRDADGVDRVPMANQADNKWSLVPREAASQLHKHNLQSAVRGPLDNLGRRWRSGILSTSTKWLTGQYAEGLLRLMIQHGFNPLSIRASNRYAEATLAELKKTNPMAARQLEAIYTRGSAGRLANQSREAYHNDTVQIRAAADLNRSMADALRDGVFWNTKVRGSKAAKHMGNIIGAYQEFVFHDLNGRYEQAIRKPMLGKILRERPDLRDMGMPANLNAAAREASRLPVLQDKSIVPLYAKAVQEAAQGKLDTATMNLLTRKMDDAFGQYQGRKPWEQAIIEGYTPFIPWALSAVKFLGKVMPRDHPIMSALAANANNASEDWRRKYGSVVESLDQGGPDSTLLPLRKQGLLPISGQLRDVTHYTPFSIGQSWTDYGNFFLPQFQALFHAAVEGEDWRGHKLSGDPYEPTSTGRQFAATLQTLGELLVPPIGAAENVLGVRGPNQAPLSKTEKETRTKEGGGDLIGRLKKQFHPLPVKKGIPKQTGPLAGFGGKGFDPSKFKVDKGFDPSKFKVDPGFDLSKLKVGG